MGCWGGGRRGDLEEEEGKDVEEGAMCATAYFFAVPSPRFGTSKVQQFLNFILSLLCICLPVSVSSRFLYIF